MYNKNLPLVEPSFLLQKVLHDKENKNGEV